MHPGLVRLSWRRRLFELPGRSEPVGAGPRPIQLGGIRGGCSPSQQPPLARRRKGEEDPLRRAFIAPRGHELLEPPTLTASLTVLAMVAAGVLGARRVGTMAVRVERQVEARVSHFHRSMVADRGWISRDRKAHQAASALRSAIEGIVCCGLRSMIRL